LLLVHVNLLVFVSDRNTQHLDVFAQGRILFDRIVQPINYRRRLVANRSHRVEEIDNDQFARDLGQGKGVGSFQTQVLPIRLSGRRLQLEPWKGGADGNASRFRRMDRIADQAKKHQQNKSWKTEMFPHAQTSFPILIWVVVSPAKNDSWVWRTVIRYDKECPSTYRKHFLMSIAIAKIRNLVCSLDRNAFSGKIPRKTRRRDDCRPGVAVRV